MYYVYLNIRVDKNNLAFYAIFNANDSIATMNDQICTIFFLVLPSLIQIEYLHILDGIFLAAISLKLNYNKLITL